MESTPALIDAAAAPNVAQAPRRIARVLPLLGLPQLDRLFDYEIPDHTADIARPGVRVRIHFHGQLVNGLIVECTDTPEHEGKLRPLKDVVSAEVVYPAKLRKLVDSLAEFYGGTRSDIIRSAIPSRHARAERSRRPDAEAPTWEDLGTLATEEINLNAWSRYAFGESFADAVCSRQSTARAAWQPLPGEDVAARIAELAVATARSGSGVLIVVPDARAQNRMEAALRDHISPRQITALGAGLGPEARYRRYLDIIHGQGRVVVGTRSAAFAPVVNLSLIVLIDDADDNLVDPRAPYVHAREVLVTRASQESCSMVVASASRSAEVQLLVNSGWLHNLVPTAESAEAAMPSMLASTDSVADPELTSKSRLPGAAFKYARKALRQNLPVLVQVPRKGYVPTLSCRSCGTPARCRYCNGPLGLPKTSDPDQPAAPTCRWCGRIDARHRCHNCGSTKIRPTVLGSERTAEDLGLIFRPNPVVNSSGEHIVDEVPAGARVVVATPGAEPVVPGGYGATLLLDTWAMLGRQDLRADEEALAHWARAVMLTRNAASGGAVVIDADAALPAVGDLLTWNHVRAAERILRDREAAELPPAFHVAAVDGTPDAVRKFVAEIELPPTAELLGPVDIPSSVRLPVGVEPGEEVVRLLIRVHRTQARSLGRALKSAQSIRATKKELGSLRVAVNPIHFG